MGGATEALGFIGGSTGKEITDLLAKEGVPSRFVKIQGHTRINVTVTNDSDFKQTRLTFPGPLISKSEILCLLKQIQRLKAPGMLVIGGSLPGGCPKDFHRQIIELAANRGLGTVVDVPARFLKPILARKSFNLLLLKPNQAEFEELLGHRFRSKIAIAKAAMELAEKVALVCVSLGEHGAIFATRHQAWFGKSPRIEARGTVGAGDSMVGAMTARISFFHLTPSRNFLDEKFSIKSEAIQDIFSWGLAAGAATAEVEGTSLASFVRIRQLQGRVHMRVLIEKS